MSRSSAEGTKWEKVFLDINVSPSLLRDFHWIAVRDWGHCTHLEKHDEKSLGFMTSLYNINCHLIDENSLFDESDQTKWRVNNVMPEEWQENKTSTLGEGWKITFHHFWKPDMRAQVAEFSLPSWHSSSANACVGRLWMGFVLRTKETVTYQGEVKQRGIESSKKGVSLYMYALWRQSTFL